MKKTVKKGFTLVELLVVIAILAILATVSVVGYTAFIQRATVSNDENVAAQLNQFLTAMKADSTGEFYEELNTNGVEPERFADIHDFILKDSGINELIPQSLKYGYRFWFDFETQEYIVAKESGVSSTPSPAMQIINGIRAFAEGVGEEGEQETQYKLVAGNCFTKNGRYFMADTAGSTLADVVNGFHTLEKYENEATDDKKGIISFFGDIQSDEIKNNYKALYDLANTTVFVTKDGNYVLEFKENNMWKNEGNHTNIVIQANANFIDLIKRDAKDRIQQINKDNPIITVSEDTKIFIPKGVMIPKDGLTYINFISTTEGEGEEAITTTPTVTLVINIRSWNEQIGVDDHDAPIYINDIFDNSFTGTENIIIKINGDNTEYRIGETTENNCSGNIVTKNDDDTESFVYELGDGRNFPLESFDIKVAPVDGKVLNFKKTEEGSRGYNSYVAIDNRVEYGKIFTNGFELILDNINEGKKPASKIDVTYTITKVHIDGKDITETGKWDKSKNIETYVTNIGSSFNIINKNVDYIEIQVTDKDNDKVLNTITVNVVRPTAVTELKLVSLRDGKTYTAVNNNGAFYFTDVENGYNVEIAGEDGKVQTVRKNTMFKISATVKTNYADDNITLDGFTFTFGDSTAFDFGDNTIILKDSLLGATEEISYTLGDGLLDGTFTLAMVDKSNMTATTSKIKYVGDENQILVAGDLINLVDGKEMPSDAKIFVGKATGNKLYSYNQTFALNNTNEFTPSPLSNIEGSEDGIALAEKWEETELKFRELQDGESEQLIYIFIAKPVGDGKYQIISGVSNITFVKGYNFKNDDDNKITNTTTEKTEYIFNKDAGTNKGIAQPTGNSDNCSWSSQGWTHGSNCENISKAHDLERVVDIWAKYKNNDNDANYHTRTNRNIVLLADYTLPSGTYLTLGTNKTLYGNLFELNLKDARTNGQGVIELTAGATLRDVKILGRAYDKENDPYVSTNVLSSDTDDGFYNYINGTAASVRIIGQGATIVNCYISGGRAPVRVQTKNAIIKDTVLFGGAYSNLDIQNGSTITLENIVTVSEKVNGSPATDNNFNNKLCPGIVISGDKEDNSAQSTVHIYIKGTFEQYNYVSVSEAGDMANSAIGLLYPTMENLLKETSESFVFEYNDTNYYNIGIFWLDRKNFEADGDNYKINVHYNDTYLPPYYASRVYDVMHDATLAARYNTKASDIETYLAMGEYYMPTRIDTPNHFQMGYGD